jgi:hypothetical protein
VNAAKSDIAAAGQLIFIVTAPRFSSTSMSRRQLAPSGAGAMVMGMNCGDASAGTAAGPRTSLRQACTMLLLMPCVSATLATDAPGASHSATTCALNAALYWRRLTTLSVVFVSTWCFEPVSQLDPRLHEHPALSPGVLRP